MGWSFLESIPIIGKLFSDTTDIIKEVVVDKDAQNKILENLELIKLTVDKELHIKELETKTIPWVDAVHKLGRQGINFLTATFIFVLMMMGKYISPEEALVLTGGNAVYQWIKGKGK